MRGVSYMIVYVVDDNDHILILSSNNTITNKYDLPDPFYVWCQKCGKSIEFIRSDIIIGNSVGLVSFVIFIIMTYGVSAIMSGGSIAMILLSECIVVLLLAFVYFRDKSRVSAFLDIE